MKRILTTLSKKWPEYLLEILVLVIGIYGAFALENWKERNTLRNEAKTLYQNLASDFQANAVNLEKNNVETTLAVQCGIKMLQFFADKGLPDQDLADTLIYNLLLVPKFTPTEATLLDIINTGKSRLIENEKLRNLILTFPGKVAEIKRLEDRSNDLLRSGLFPYLFEHHSFARMDSRMNSFGMEWPCRSFKSDLEFMFNDRKFESMVDDHIWRCMELIQRQKLLSEDIQNIQYLLTEASAAL